MANAMPWSVRGVDPDIREQAVEAAQRSGLSVGQWLNQVLSGNLDADEAEAEPAPQRRARRRPSRLDELADRIDRLGKGPAPASTAGSGMDENTQMLALLENAVEAIERLERKNAAPAAFAPDTRRAAGPEKIADILQGLEKRLDTLSRPQAPIVAGTPAMGLAQDNPAFVRALAEIEARRRSLDGDVAPRAQQAPAAPADATRQTLDLLVTRLDEMRARPAPDTARLEDRLDQIAARLAETRDDTRAEDVAALRRDLAGIADTIAQLSPGRLVGLVEEAVESVVDRLVEARADHLPARLIAPIERMHEDVQAVMREVSSSRGLDRLSEEVDNLARRLDIIADGAAGSGRLEDIARETEEIKALVAQTLRAQPFEGLARQIEALGEQIRAFKPLPGQDRAVIDAVHDVRDRLERIDPAAAFRGIEQKLGAISRLEDKIDGLARGMERLAADAKPLPQLDSIAARLERIDRALDSGKDQPLGGLDQLAGRLEAIGASLDRVSAAPQNDQIVAMLERISHSVDRAQHATIDPNAFEAIHGEIARLARRIEDHGGADNSGIQRGVADLLTEFDVARRDMREAAEVAAKRAAEEAVRRAPRDDKGDALAAEGLLLIKRDLGEFKSAQSEAERRMRQTLEAVQGTLDTLVQRLAPLEAAARQPAPVMEAPARAPVSEPAPVVERAAPAGGREAPELQVPTPAASPAASPAAARAPAPQAEMLDDLPLEPGLKPGEGEAAAPADPKANFIAARRAALAAAERQASAAEPEKPSRKARMAQAAAGAAERSPAVDFIVRSRKTILLGIATLVFSLGAVKVWMQKAPEPVQKPAISKPAPVEDEPNHTQGIGPNAQPAESQPIPTIGPKDSKRGQRLSDSSAITQSDPLAVGSINAEGAARAVETGRTAIASLMEQTGIKVEDGLREAALAGNAAAHFEIGARLADGRGVTRNPQAAARWFEQGAAIGHAPSQYRLASLYREGRGVPKDPTLAFQWFDRAAAQGHVLAMHNAAVLLAEGVHGAPDYAGAALWFRRAAEHGTKDSQFNVAILFARGLGVSQDLAESYRWFAIAALQGDQDAAKKRDDIAARLTKEQLAKESEKVKAFKPTRANPAANEPGSWSKVASRAP